MTTAVQRCRAWSGGHARHAWSAVALAALLNACAPAPCTCPTNTRAAASPATTGGEVPSRNPRSRSSAPTAPHRGHHENPLDAEYEGQAAQQLLRGRASYYHDSLAGNHTANGEVYDPAAFTAAHRQLPFGTVVRVIRVDNGRSVTVRINDRGPFGRRQRILDLSRAAAAQLDMIAAGVTDVRVEVLHIPQP